MELFISGEVSEGAGPGLREAAVLIMDTVNPTLDHRLYGDGIQVWYYIPIIFHEPVPGFDEVANYNSAEKYIEFKKILDYTEFVHADLTGRCKLMINGLLQTIDEASTMNISAFDLQALRHDLTVLARGKQWLL